MIQNWNKMKFPEMTSFDYHLICHKLMGFDPLQKIDDIYLNKGEPSRMRDTINEIFMQNLRKQTRSLPGIPLE